MSLKGPGKIPRAVGSLQVRRKGWVALSETQTLVHPLDMLECWMLMMVSSLRVTSKALIIPKFQSAMWSQFLSGTEPGCSDYILG